MIIEKCINHPDKEAQLWREAILYGEPDRCPLCFDCCQEIKKLGLPFSLYPLNEVHLRDKDNYYI
jgi:hypothetical protein